MTSIFNYDANHGGAILFFAAIILGSCVASSADEPKRPLRSESFVGIHFDFHAGEKDENIGSNTTPEMVQAIIDKVHPDFIQVDSKGHAGWCSYPTKVGNPSPGVTADSLKVWREVTAKNGVALYTHYSGVWDHVAATRHPEWAVVNKDGSKSTDITSVFSEYKSKLLAPQLLEFALDYGTDGVWIDGDCWATRIDYGNSAKVAFTKATGRTVVPTAPNQDGWREWCDFHREAFRQYLRYYITEVKSKAPSYQIASNWAFTDHMAEPITADVDFISGDYSPNNSVNAARYSARLMANQGKAWDLMAWSFATQNGTKAKPGVQLCREAACVLALGGSFQAYYTQNRDGSVNLSKLDSMAEVAKFCRERQALCQYSTGVPQVALFCPAAAHYRNLASQGDSLFPRISWQFPVLYRLLDLNYSVDVLTDSVLTRRITEFPVVVFFRGDLWSDELKTQVKQYLLKGGSVVVIGNESISEIARALGNLEKKEESLFENDWEVDVYQFGQGTIVSFPTPDGEPSEFLEARGTTFEKRLEAVMKRAFPKPIVELPARKPLDISVRFSKNGELTIHFVNVSGPHETEPIIENIDPVENVEIALNLKQRPTSLKLEPSGIKLPFEWNDGVARTTAPSVPIHEILVVE